MPLVVLVAQKAFGCQKPGWGWRIIYDLYRVLSVEFFFQTGGFAGF